MRRAIARHAHRMQWSAVDSGHLEKLLPHKQADAFDIVLDATWAHARTPNAVLDGKMMQQRGRQPTGGGQQPLFVGD